MSCKIQFHGEEYLLTSAGFIVKIADCVGGRLNVPYARLMSDGKIYRSDGERIGTIANIKVLEGSVKVTINPTELLKVVKGLGIISFN